MHSELPVFKRCCFCLPLRYGLIAWGYIKLILAALLIVVLSQMLNSLVHTNQLYPSNTRIFTIRIAILIVFLFLVTFDFILSTIFIVGGHTKNLRFLEVYYYYCFVLWILTILLSIFIVSSYLNSLINYQMSPLYAWILRMMEISSLFVSMVSQGYFLLLLRSEILKLKNNCEFRFVNNAAQSECKMDCKKDTLDANKTIGCKEDCYKVASDV